MFFVSFFLFVFLLGLLMRTSNWSILDLVSSPWPMPDPTPMDPNSSSAPSRPSGQLTSLSCLYMYIYLALMIPRLVPSVSVLHHWISEMCVIQPYPRTQQVTASSLGKGASNIIRFLRDTHTNVHVHLALLLGPYRGFRSLRNLVAISQRYCWPLLTFKAGCIGNNGKNWLFNPGTSSQNEGYSSKWLIWLVCREPMYV